MSYQDRDFGSLVAEIQKASLTLAEGDNRFDRRLDAFQKDLDMLYREVQRPGSSGENANSADFERKSASEMCGDSSRRACRQGRRPCQGIPAFEQRA
jgi:hypothetical protein